MIKLKDLLTEGNIIYARGFPHGAPLVMLRGGATRDPKVKAFLKSKKFSWDGEKHAWTHYLHGPEFKKILVQLKKMGHNVTPKKNMDKNYVIKLDEYDRDYKDEYKKFQSSPKMRKYRSDLNKYNRKKGTYGNGDGKDASHKGGKISGFESQSKNRGRREKSRTPGRKK